VRPPAGYQEIELSSRGLFRTYIPDGPHEIVVSRSLVTSLGAIVASVLLALTGAAAQADPAPAPSLRPAFVYELPPNAEAARSELATLTVEPQHSMAGYSREEFLLLRLVDQIEARLRP
jgi:hypothetical protein